MNYSALLYKMHRCTLSCLCESPHNTMTPSKTAAEQGKPQKVDMPKIHAPTWQSQCASHLLMMQKLYCSRLCERDLGISIYVHGNIHLCTCPCAHGQMILVGTIAHSLRTPSSVIQITYHIKILWFSLIYALFSHGTLARNKTSCSLLNLYLRPVNNH